MSKKDKEKLDKAEKKDSKAIKLPTGAHQAAVPDDIEDAARQTGENVRPTSGIFPINSAANMGESNVGRSIKKRPSTLAGVSLDDWLVSDEKVKEWADKPVDDTPTGQDKKK
ncbi:MAG: hypothetical protein GMKNLPBB_00963 [Myxococcota bacterium]|nr:hypothetical protein [Myxococcota bacterium]